MTKAKNPEQNMTLLDHLIELRNRLLVWFCAFLFLFFLCFIKFTDANLVYGEKKRKKIVGPEDWKNPQTGKTIKVYKRTR